MDHDQEPAPQVHDGLSSGVGRLVWGIRNPFYGPVFEKLEEAEAWCIEEHGQFHLRPVDLILTGGFMAKAAPIRVVLADDHAMIRQGLRSALEAYPNIEVVGEAGDGDEAVLAASKLQPAIIVMDINMSKMDGITATRLIKMQHPQMVVIGLTIDPKGYLIDAMQKAGAAELLGKDQAVNELYGAIQRAVASIQPILILEDTPALAKSHAESEEVASSNPEGVAQSEGGGSIKI